MEIEACAREPFGTARINVDGAIAMIADVIAAGAVPIYTSTDYVWGSRGGWSEQGGSNPTTRYGQQKLLVEHYLATRTAPWMRARLSKVVGGEL